MCDICMKEDTETLTLKQCMGCITYCYCSEVSQNKHWVAGHKGECKQLKILNKHHKRHAKEIREASIRGEIHPALEQLRHKLGLSRPTDNYQELKMGTHEKSLHPLQHIFARDDGTVWFRSTPNSIGTSSKSYTPPTTDTTTTSACTITSIASANDDHFN